MVSSWARYVAGEHDLTHRRTHRSWLDQHLTFAFYRDLGVVGVATPPSDSSSA